MSALDYNIEKLNVKYLGTLVLVVFLAISGCTPNSQRNCSQKVLSPMTVSMVMSQKRSLSCGSVSVYGYLTKIPRRKSGNAEEYFLVSQRELLSESVGLETLRLISVSLDFSGMEYGAPPHTCYGEFVRASGDLHIDGSIVVLSMDDSSSMTRVSNGESSPWCSE